MNVRNLAVGAGLVVFLALCGTAAAREVAEGYRQFRFGQEAEQVIEEQCHYIEYAHEEFVTFSCEGAKLADTLSLYLRIPRNVRLVMTGLERREDGGTDVYLVNEDREFQRLRLRHQEMLASAAS